VTRFSTVLLSMIAVFVFASSSQASNCAVDEYDHNGSTMEIQECDDGLWISYIEPRDGLKKVGVEDGTLLFEGEVGAAGTIIGQARLFSAKCGEILYDVSGAWRSNSILLEGIAPVRDSSCRVTKYRNDELLFTLETYADNTVATDWYAIVGSFKKRSDAQRKVDQINNGIDDWFVLDTDYCPNFTNGYWIATIGPFEQAGAKAWKDWTGQHDAYIKRCN